MKKRKFRKEVIFDHIDLDEDSRTLIKKVCPHVEQIFLSPLEKGLSGSTVWLGTWKVGGKDAVYVVFKIGIYGRLFEENEALDKFCNDAYSIPVSSF